MVKYKNCSIRNDTVFFNCRGLQ